MNTVQIEEQKILYANKLSNKEFINFMMDKIIKYDLLSEKDLEMLVDRKKGRELFKCDYSYFKLIENEKELNSLIRDGKGVTRYYNNCYTLCGKKYVVTSQLYDGTTHKDSKTPFSMWIANKFREKYATSASICDYIASSGFTYSEQLIKNLYLSLKAKPFVILAGVSGTGKSKLAALFAEAIKAKFKMISVRPDWSDATDLFGYVDLNQKFRPGCLTSIIKEANKPENLNTPYIICLDEMNLAVVEHYFSDVLSVMETRKLEKGGITSKPFIESTMLHTDEEKKRYGDLYFSQNLYFIGTVNMDETTHSFSKKVLDRANIIELSEINLNLGLEAPEETKPKTIAMDNYCLMSEYFGIQQCYSEYEKDIRWIINILSDINQQLKSINAQFAYRVRDEISYYVSYALKYKLFSREEAMDLCIMQKILPRISGRGEEMRKLLVELFNLCLKSEQDRINVEEQGRIEKMQKLLEIESEENKESKFNFPLSAGKITFMLRKCEGEFGYGSYWL